MLPVKLGHWFCFNKMIFKNFRKLESVFKAKNPPVYSIPSLSKKIFHIHHCCQITEISSNYDKVSPGLSLKKREHPLITHFNKQVISALEVSFWESILRCSLIMITGEGFRRFKVFFLNSNITIFFLFTMICKSRLSTCW